MTANIMTQSAHLAFIQNLGPGELLLIFCVILLLFGAKKLPQLARGLGKSMGEFKKAREEFEHEIARAEDEVTSAPKTTSPEESGPREKDQS